MRYVVCKHQDEGLHKESAQGDMHVITKAKELMSKTFPGIAKAYNGIDWSLAFDYFTCRRAHSMDIHQDISNFSHDHSSR